MYAVHVVKSAIEPWVQFSIPIPYRGQTPLAELVSSEPPDKVSGFSIVRDSLNRYLRVFLRPLAAGEHVKLCANTIVLVRREKSPAGDGVALASMNEIPADVRKYLEPAPGVEAGDARIRTIAKGFSRRDLKTAVADLLAFLAKNVKGGSGTQGAIDVLERGTAACTGHANLGAALLIAAEVPTRILPCILIGRQQQEHFIVEAWTPELGWSKIETTGKIFPLDDSRHLILRFVDPSSPRSGGDVPLYCPIASGVDVHFGGENHAWQSARVLEKARLEEDELDVIEACARKTFDALIETPHDSACQRFVPTTRAPAGIGARGKKLLEMLQRYLDA
jgi:transglutaminase-like putative cysteine protease